MKKTTKINPETRKKLYTTDPIKWIVDDYGSLILTRKKEILKITVSKSGIDASYRNETNLDNISFNSSNNISFNNINFPGEIPLDRFVKFLSETINAPFYNQKPSDIKVFEKPIELVEYALREQKLTILTALRKSKIWEKRGFSDPQKRAPKEYWKSLPIHTIIRYDGNKNPKVMWRNIFLSEIGGRNIHKSKQTESNILNDAIFQKAIELKIFPEVPWGIRKWSNFKLESLVEYISAGTTRSKHWANYATTCFMFDATMRGHSVLTQGYREGSPLQKKRDEFMEFLYKWPKTKAGIGSMEEAFNQGMDMMNILDIQPKNPKELLDCVQVWRQMREENRLHLNETYEVPKIPLKDGYKYVDHTDARQISDDYSCCFSNSSQYIDTICRGEGFAIYRPHFKGSDKGSLCFFELKEDLKTQKQIWVINEHRGHGNSNPDKQYIQDMKVILRTINVTHPYPFPKIVQEREKGIQDLIEINPKFGKIIKIIENENRDILNQICEYSTFESMEDLVSMEGYNINLETYRWEPTTEEYRQELIQNNNIAEKLMYGTNEIDQEEIEKEIKKYELNMQEKMDQEEINEIEKHELSM